MFLWLNLGIEFEILGEFFGNEIVWRFLKFHVVYVLVFVVCGWSWIKFETLGEFFFGNIKIVRE